jgi:hypothetical protein
LTESLIHLLSRIETRCKSTRGVLADNAPPMVVARLMADADTMLSRLERHAGRLAPPAPRTPA